MNAKTIKRPSKSAIKALNIRMSKDSWMFLKQCSMNQEVSVNAIVNKLIDTYKAKGKVHA